MIKFITDFINRNNNLDAIILILIGIGLPILAKIGSYFFTKITKLAKREINKVLRFIHRRIKGEYLMKEMPKILAKPENKRSKKEKLAVEKHKELRDKTREAIENVIFATEHIKNLKKL